MLHLLRLRYSENTSSNDVSTPARELSHCAKQQQNDCACAVFSTLLLATLFQTILEIRLAKGNSLREPGKESIWRKLKKPKPQCCKQPGCTEAELRVLQPAVSKALSTNNFYCFTRCLQNRFEQLLVAPVALVSCCYLNLLPRIPC